MMSDSSNLLAHSLNSPQQDSSFQESNVPNHFDSHTLCGEKLGCIRGDRQLFNNLDFELKSGQCLLVEGKNGCGKTTLLKTLATLRHTDDGDVIWNDQNIYKQIDVYHEALLWIGHLPALKPDLSAFENLKIASAIQIVKPSDDELEQALDNCGLTGYDDLPSRVLSQGQKKKALLANLLVTQSPLWILDEPFVGLDVNAVAWLCAIIETHLKRNGMVILTTHQQVPIDPQFISVLKLDNYASKQVHVL